MKFHQDGTGLVTLLRGVQRLQHDATVREAGLEDGEELSMLWSKKYYEAATLGQDDMQSPVMDQYKDLVGRIYVQIPDTVDCIEDAAFHHCSSLTQVLIPDSITSIGSGAFRDCSHSIGDSAFLNCSSLTQVVIPHSVTSIGDAAFCGCSSALPKW